MKYLLLSSTLTLSLLFSSVSSAEWSITGATVTGHTTYIDFDRIRKNGGYVYAWTLTDYLKPTKHGDMSNKIYREVDCKAFRYRALTIIFYKQPMGEGNADTNPAIDKEWEYPPPESIGELVVNTVCAQ